MLSPDWGCDEMDSYDFDDNNSYDEMDSYDLDDISFDLLKLREKVYKSTKTKKQPSKSSYSSTGASSARKTVARGKNKVHFESTSIGDKKSTDNIRAKEDVGGKKVDIRGRGDKYGYYRVDDYYSKAKDRSTFPTKKPVGAEGPTPTPRKPQTSAPAPEPAPAPAAPKEKVQKKQTASTVAHGSVERVYEEKVPLLDSTDQGTEGTPCSCACVTNIRDIVREELSQHMESRDHQVKHLKADLKKARADNHLLRRRTEEMEHSLEECNAKIKQFLRKQSANYLEELKDVFRRMAAARFVSPEQVGYVGEGAEPIGESNLGHQMMTKMGWQPGSGLGREGSGITKPVTAPIRPKRRGLGGTVTSENPDAK